MIATKHQLIFFRAFLFTGIACLTFQSAASSRGVTPYIPLNFEPHIERQIERVLMLAGKPVMRRPIPAATVLAALPAACKVDAELCEEVETYLRTYIPALGITHMRATAALAAGDSDQVIPNAHGMRAQSLWNVHSNAYYQLNDFALVNFGALSYQGRTAPTGSVLSVGTSYAQLDLGYRDHWFSPLRDSSSLISTEAPTMPSATLSNYEPISRLNLSYELFVAKMSAQNGIAYLSGSTDGNPYLAGLQTSIEPTPGYALSVNRVFQYGGGQRNTGRTQFMDALFKNSNRADNADPGALEFGNQAASLSSSFLVPGSVPFAINVEYAGEDNAWSGPYRLGSTNMSLGVDFPQLLNKYDLTVEVSSWQQAWYVHHIYPQGLTNEGIVVGHWFGDARLFGVDGFGSSASIQLGTQFKSGNYLRAKYRYLENASYIPVPYQHRHELGLNYHTNLWKRRTDAEINFGRDVFGKTFARLSLSMDMVPSLERISREPAEQSSADESTDYFVDAGVNFTRAYQILARDINFEWTHSQVSYHAGFGVRRNLGDHNDLGMRLELDEIADRKLTSLRVIDYRYRVNTHAAVGGFFGVSRYDIFSLPAYGYYWGAGLQWTNLLKGWDLGLDWRYNDKLTRTKVKASDPSKDDGAGIFVDTHGYLMYLSRHF